MQYPYRHVAGSQTEPRAQPGSAVSEQALTNPQRDRPASKGSPVTLGLRFSEKNGIFPIPNSKAFHPLVRQSLLLERGLRKRHRCMRVAD